MQAERSLRIRLRRILTPATFLAPAGLLIGAFFLIPALVTLWMSMTDMSTATFSHPGFIGLDNYVKMFKSRWTVKIAQNTVFYVIMVLIFFNVGLAMVLSILTTEIPKRVGTIFRVLWLLPRITPVVVYIMIWQYATAPPPAGIITQVAGWLGLEGRNWLRLYPWFFVILSNGFVGASFGMIIFTSAIESISKDLLIAAQVDGANRWQIIRRIKLPLIRWPIMYVLSYQTLSLLTSFQQIQLLTDGGPGLFKTEVWALNAYHNALANYWGNIDFGYGSALFIILAIVGGIAAAAYLRIFRFNEMLAEPRVEEL